MSDGYQAWAERVIGGRTGRPIEEGELVRSSSGRPFDCIEFARTERPKYTGEVGKKSGDYIYHFFPPASTKTEGYGFPHKFEDKMGDAFLEVFKLQEKVQARFVPEMHSWAVRVLGYAVNPMADELAISVFDVLDKKLGG